MSNHARRVRERIEATFSHRVASCCQALLTFLGSGAFLQLAMFIAILVLSQALWVAHSRKDKLSEEWKQRMTALSGYAIQCFQETNRYSQQFAGLINLGVMHKLIEDTEELARFREWQLVQTENQEKPDS